MFGHYLNNNNNNYSGGNENSNVIAGRAVADSVLSMNSAGGDAGSKISTMPPMTTPLPRIRPLVPTKELIGHYGQVHCGDWLPDSVHCVTASHDSNLVLWHAPTGLKKSVIRLQSAFVMACAVDQAGYGNASSFDTGLVAVGGLDNTVNLYRLQDYTNSVAEQNDRLDGNGLMRGPSLNGTVNPVVTAGSVNIGMSNFSAGSSAASLDAMNVPNVRPKNKPALNSVESSSTLSQKYRSSTGAFLNNGGYDHASCTFAGHEGFISALGFTDNGSKLLSGSDDRTVALWDVEAGTCIERVSTVLYILNKTLGQWWRAA